MDPRIQGNAVEAVMPLRERLSVINDMVQDALTQVGAMEDKFDNGPKALLGNNTTAAPRPTFPVDTTMAEIVDRLQALNARLQRLNGRL